MKTKTKGIGSLLAASLVFIPSFFVASCEQDDGLSEYEMRQQYTLSPRMMGASGEVPPINPVDSLRDSVATDMMDLVEEGQKEATLFSFETDGSDLWEFDPDSVDPENHNASTSGVQYSVNVTVNYRLYRSKVQPYYYQVQIVHYVASRMGFTLTSMTTSDGNSYNYYGVEVVTGLRFKLEE